MNKPANKPASQQDQPVRTSSLYAALQQAQQNIKDVPKDSTVRMPGRPDYSYTSAEVMVAACRVAMLKAGLVAFRSSHAILPLSLDQFAMPAQPAALVVSTFQLVHPESGERMTDEWPAIALAYRGYSLDKAVAGALTSSWSGYLRDKLLVPRFEEEQLMQEQAQAEAEHKPPGQLHRPPMAAALRAIEEAANHKDTKGRLAELTELIKIRHHEGRFSDGEYEQLLDAAESKLIMLSEQSDDRPQQEQPTKRPQRGKPKVETVTDGSGPEAG